MKQLNKTFLLMKTLMRRRNSTLRSRKDCNLRDKLLKEVRVLSSLLRSKAEAKVELLETKDLLVMESTFRSKTNNRMKFRSNQDLILKMRDKITFQFLLSLIKRKQV